MNRAYEAFINLHRPFFLYYWFQFFFNAGIYRPFTVDDIPRPSCDHKQQTDVLHKNPETKVRGPLPIRLFPAFKSGKHIFGSEYNLADKSQSMLSFSCPSPIGVLFIVHNVVMN